MVADSIILLVGSETAEFPAFALREVYMFIKLLSASPNKVSDDMETCLGHTEAYWLYTFGRHN